MMTSYIIQYAVICTVMTNVCQHFMWSMVEKPREPGQSCWDRCGAFVLICIATFLIQLNPLKNLLVNVAMESFKTNGFDSTIESVLDFSYSPLMSERPVQMYTACGYVLMMWATAKQTDLFAKFGITFRKAKAAAGGNLSA
jgi:hypothetical protein